MQTRPLVQTNRHLHDRGLRPHASDGLGRWCIVYAATHRTQTFSNLASSTLTGIGMAIGGCLGNVLILRFKAARHYLRSVLKDLQEQSGGPVSDFTHPLTLKVRAYGQCLCRVDCHRRREAPPECRQAGVAIIKGTQTISGKGELHKGQRVVFVPPGILIPQDVSQSLGIQKYLKHAEIDGIKCQCRVAACRLRGEPSFGFVIPAPDLLRALRSAATCR